MEESSEDVPLGQHVPRGPPALPPAATPSARRGKGLPPAATPSARRGKGHKTLENYDEEYINQFRTLPTFAKKMKLNVKDMQSVCFAAGFKASACRAKDEQPNCIMNCFYDELQTEYFTTYGEAPLPP
jgi:hypothetical protein